MGLIKGGFQRIAQTLLYVLLFLCSAIILGIFSYFLSVLADRNLPIHNTWKAVEGISGAAVLYLIFAVCLTCCLGGIAVLAFLAIVLDVCFAGGMIAIAVLTRNGASSCKGNVNTPIGNGPASSDNGYGRNGFGLGNNDNTTYSVHLGLACRLETACFAVAIIAALLFLCTAAMQILLVRHHKKEKRFGPSPSNNYTSGYAKRGLFGRKKKDKTTRDAEAAGEMQAAQNGHTSANYSSNTGHTGHTSANYPTTTGHTGHTGTTGTAAGTTGVPYEKYENQTQQPNTYNTQYAQRTAGTHNAYHTAPTGTAVNPYGYSNQATNY